MKIKLPKFDSQFGLILVVMILLIINVAFIFGFSDQTKDQQKIIYLTTPDCETCFNLDPFTEYLQQSGADTSNIQEISYSSFSGKRLLNKYDITKVPTIIFQNTSDQEVYISELLEGEIIEEKNGDYLVSKLQPPYLDLENSKELVGEFEVIYLSDETCLECYDVTEHDTVFERLSMRPSSKKVIDISSEEGQALVELYFITAVPTILLRGDLAEYQNFNTVWEKSGSIEEDGTYVLRRGIESMGTYKKIPSGEIVVPESNS